MGTATIRFSATNTDPLDFTDPAGALWLSSPRLRGSVVGGSAALDSRDADGSYVTVVGTNTHTTPGPHEFVTARPVLDGAIPAGAEIIGGSMLWMLRRDVPNYTVEYWPGVVLRGVIDGAALGDGLGITTGPGSVELPPRYVDEWQYEYDRVRPGRDPSWSPQPIPAFHAEWIARVVREGGYFLIHPSNGDNHADSRHYLSQLIVEVEYVRGGSPHLRQRQRDDLRQRQGQSRQRTIRQRGYY